MRGVLPGVLSLDDAAPTHPHRRVVLLARTCRRGDRPARAAGAWARVVLPPYEQPEGRAPLEPPSLPRQRALRRDVRLLRAPQPPGLHEFAHGEAVEGFEPGTGSPVMCWPAKWVASVPMRPRSTCANSVPWPSPTVSCAVDGAARPACFRASLMDDPRHQARPARRLRTPPRRARLRAPAACAWRSPHRRRPRAAPGARSDRRANRIRDVVPSCGVTRRGAATSRARCPPASACPTSSV